MLPPGQPGPKTLQKAEQRRKPRVQRQTKAAASKHNASGWFVSRLGSPTAAQSPHKAYCGWRAAFSVTHGSLRHKAAGGIGNSSDRALPCSQAPPQIRRHLARQQECRSGKGHKAPDHVPAPARGHTPGRNAAATHAHRSWSRRFFGGVSQFPSRTSGKAVAHAPLKAKPALAGDGRPRAKFVGVAPEAYPQHNGPAPLWLAL